MGTAPGELKLNLTAAKSLFIDEARGLAWGWFMLLPATMDPRSANAACFIVKDQNGQALAERPAGRAAANLLTLDEAAADRGEHRERVMRAAGAAAEVRVAAHIQARLVGVRIREGVRNMAGAHSTAGAAHSTAGVGNLESICAPTDPDAFQVGTLRKRPT